MIAAWPRFVAVVLSVVFTGVAHACLCAGMTKPIATAVAKVDPHACCKPDGEQKPATPADDPCKTCHAAHPPTLIAPEKIAKVVAPDLAFVATFAVMLPSIQTSDVRVQLNDDVPIPPLLRDLVHSSCQLTV
jgi:hypothetical protein